MDIVCALIDDQKNDIARIKSVLERISYGSDNTFKVFDYSDPVSFDTRSKYDIYIVDIDMPEMSGFNLSARIMSYYPEAIIIFCTSYDHFVFDSFKLNAYFFVRKSFLETDMTTALHKYIKDRLKLQRYYPFQTDGYAVKLLLTDIIYFEVSHNDLFIHMKDGTEYRERRTMKSVVKLLSFASFIQISQTFLVNVDYITKIENKQVCLSNGQKIGIPKTNLNRVIREYLYLR